MPPKCLNKQPQFRLRIHTPANPLHRHIDNTLQVSASTDWEAWAKLIRYSLQSMGYSNDRFVLGFYLDLLNGLPEHYRWALIRGILEGRGLQVRTEEEEGENVLVIDLPQKYEPLAGAKQTESGLVIPKQPVGVGDIILPGDPNFQA